jgi:hypothetical protein
VERHQGPTVLAFSIQRQDDRQVPADRAFKYQIDV